MTHEQWLIKRAINKGQESIEASKVIALIDIALEVGRLSHLKSCKLSTRPEINECQERILQMKRRYES